MSKRKYQNSGGTYPDNVGFAFTSRDSRSPQRLERVVDDSKTQLHKALKLARGFERQKLGRRQKDASQKNDDGELSRLANEIAALKVGKLQACSSSLIDRA